MNLSDLFQSFGFILLQISFNHLASFCCKMWQFTKHSIFLVSSPEPKQ